MIIYKIKNQYSFFQKCNLLLRWIITKILFSGQRLIRNNIEIRGRKMIQFGIGLTTGVGCRIEAFIADGNKGKKIFFGDRIQLNDHVHISALQSVTIGDDTLIASYVYISDNSHGCYNNKGLNSNPETNPIERHYIVDPVKIGSRVWIGEGVMIMPGVSIGDGSIIGAHSVVNTNIPPNTIVVGSPAKVIKRWDEKKQKWLKNL